MTDTDARPADTDADARAFEADFWREIGERDAIRVAVRALILVNDHVLVQRLNHAESFHWFPGGELDMGETLEGGLRRELAEELGMEPRTVTYRFAFNNRFTTHGARCHFLEHYFEVTVDSDVIASQETHFGNIWVPLADLPALDLRPHGVRDILAVPGWRTIRLLEAT